MTRIQAKELLVSLGIESPTDEQITNYLNTLNGEVKKANDRAEQYKKDADRVVELQKALDDLNNANLSDIDKANKETQLANDEIAKLKNQIKNMETKNSLLANGIKEEEATKILESISSGTFDATILGEIIADRTKSAIADYEKKALESTPSPNGNGGADGGSAEKTELDKVVDIAKSMYTPDTKSTDIINAYK